MSQVLGESWFPSVESHLSLAEAAAVMARAGAPAVFVDGTADSPDVEFLTALEVIRACLAGDPHRVTVGEAVAAAGRSRPR